MHKPRFLAFPSLLAFGLLVAPACADDAIALDEGEVGTSEAGEAGPTTATSGEVTSAEVTTGEVTTGEEETTGTTGPNMHPDPEGLEPIKGFNISGVTANQGVTVAIANGTSWNDGNGRNTLLVNGRRTLVRVWWTLDPDWVPREVHCRLELWMENGESRDYWNVVDNVSVDTNPSSLATTCNFLLNEEDVETSPGTTFQVSVWEPTGNGEGLTPHPTVSPADGPQQIGFEAYPMEMDMLMVQIEYQGGVPPIEQNLQVFHDALLEQKPLQKVHIAVRDEAVPLVNPTLNAINATLDQLRVTDEAPWNQYYFGFVNTGQQSGTVGLAGLGGIVAAGLWRSSISGNAGTFVHEVGHNLNMSHVECPSFGMPPYAVYPYANGRIGIPGYGIVSGEMYNPNNYYNYMTYCGPTWVSDWNFNTAWQRIYSATNDPPPIPEWPPPLPPDEPMPDWIPEGQIPVLRGVLGADGYEEWWTTVAEIDPELLSGTQHFSFVQEGYVVAEMLGEVRVMQDDNSLWVTVPLTREIDLDEVTITRESAGTEYEVELLKEKQLHKLVLERYGITANTP